MGSSKIIFVGAVAVVIGMFGFGIKRAERQSAQIAEMHVFQVQAKALAMQGLERAIRSPLPKSLTDPVPFPYTRTIDAGTFGYSVSPFMSNTVRVNSYGIVMTQRVDIVSTLTYTASLTPGPNTWAVYNTGGVGWKLTKMTRKFSTVGG